MGLGHPVNVEFSFGRHVMPLAIVWDALPRRDASFEGRFREGLRFHVALVEMFFHQGLFKVKRAHLDLKGKVARRRIKKPAHLPVVGFNVFDGGRGKEVYMPFAGHELLRTCIGGESHKKQCKQGA